jgi:hypothetical protein
MRDGEARDISTFAEQKMNAQRPSPVGRWAFYTVICTALCGTLTQANAS